jgi:hypothetical protein
MATLNKLNKKQALDTAKTANKITVNDSSFGWSDKPVTFDEMIEIMNEYGRNWTATQYEGSNIDHIVSIDTRSGIHFEVTL